MNHTEVVKLVGNFFESHGYKRLEIWRAIQWLGYDRRKVIWDDIFYKDTDVVVLECKPEGVARLEIVKGIGKSLFYSANIPARSVLAIHRNSLPGLERLFNLVPWLGLILYSDEGVVQYRLGDYAPPVPDSIFFEDVTDVTRKTM